MPTRKWKFCVSIKCLLSIEKYILPPHNKSRGDSNSIAIRITKKEEQIFIIKSFSRKSHKLLKKNLKTGRKIAKRRRRVIKRKSKQ
jgi:hypothetical protein